MAKVSQAHLWQSRHQLPQRPHAVHFPPGCWYWGRHRRRYCCYCCCCCCSALPPDIHWIHPCKANTRTCVVAAHKATTRDRGACGQHTTLELALRLARRRAQATHTTTSSHTQTQPPYQLRGCCEAACCTSPLRPASQTRGHVTTCASPPPHPPTYRWYRRSSTLVTQQTRGDTTTVRRGREAARQPCTSPPAEYSVVL